MIVELDKRIRQELLELYDDMQSKRKLCTDQEFEKYCDTFRQKWGPERLMELEGEELLDTMHSLGEGSMMYWLAYDKDSKNLFGGILGGDTYNLSLFRKKDTGVWMSGSHANPVEYSLGEAIEKATQHRKQLVDGCILLARLRENGDDEDYQLLQNEMDRIAPDVSKTAWGHKYFHLLYPNKLEDYHVVKHQFFHLIKILQVPPFTEVRKQRGIMKRIERRYTAGGRYVAIAHNLNMKINTLTSLSSLLRRRRKSHDG